MSRIYQGGQSQNTYRAKQRSVNYSPVQAINNQVKIKEEGERKQRDLQTQSRQANRKNEMANMERQASDNAANSTLRMEQLQASQVLKQQQLVEQANQQTAHLAAKAGLSMAQTTERGQLSVEQVKDKGVLQLNNLREQNSMKLTNMQDNMNLRMVQAAKRADMALSQQHMQLSHQIDNANTQVAFTAIKGLIDFGSQYAMEQAKAIDEKREEQEIEDAIDKLIGTPSIDASGKVSSVVTEEARVQAVEVAEEQAIQQVAPGDTAAQEALRQPGADQSMVRRQNQLSITDAGLTFASRLQDRINDPNTLVLDGQGNSVPISSLRTAGERGSAILQLARQQAREDGVSRADGHAAYTNYGAAFRGAVNEQIQNGNASMHARNKKERAESGVTLGAAQIKANNAQAGWDTAYSMGVASGLYDNKSGEETNDAILKALMAQTEDKDLPKLLNVRKIGAKANTEFGNSYKYRDMINDEIDARADERNDKMATRARTNKFQVQEIQNNIALEMMKPDANAGEIREQAIQTLKTINTPEARDEIARLEGKGNRNINVYNDFVERFVKGDPPTTLEVGNAFARDEISEQQRNSLFKRGEFGDVVDRRISAAVSQTAEQQMQGALAPILAGIYGLKSDERKLMSANIVDNLAPQYQAEMRAYVVGNPNASPRDIQDKATQVIAAIKKDIGDGKTKNGESPGRLGFDENSGLTFDFKETAPVHVRLSPRTGEVQRVWTQFDVNEIPPNSSVNDIYLTTDEVKQAAITRSEGNGNYTPRVRALARKLGYAPSTFVQRQLTNMGYDTTKDIPPAANIGDISDARQGMQALEAMGVPRKGAAYLSGNIMQESSWNGQQPTWNGRAMNDGSDRNGGLVSWMDDAEKDHFRLRDIESYLGKPISEASTGEQIDAMLWEMKTTPYYQEAYEIFTNPDSNDIQLRRASAKYWGYRDEGDRFAIAKELLN
jgi:hypothetical protein